MQVATVSEFRNHAKNFFDAVEKGEMVQVYRNGKPVAVISPFVFQGRLSTPNPAAAKAHWKRAAAELGIKAPGVMQEFLSERKKERF